MKQKLLIALFWTVQLTWGLLENIMASFVFLTLNALFRKGRKNIVKCICIIIP